MLSLLFPFTSKFLAFVFVLVASLSLYFTGYSIYEVYLYFTDTYYDLMPIVYLIASSTVLALIVLIHHYVSKIIHSTLAKHGMKLKSASRYNDKEYCIKYTRLEEYYGIFSMREKETKNFLIEDGLPMQKYLSKLLFNDSAINDIVNYLDIKNKVTEDHQLQLLHQSIVGLKRELINKTENNPQI